MRRFLFSYKHSFGVVVLLVNFLLLNSHAGYTSCHSFYLDIIGYEYLAYDALGNVSVSDKTIVVPTENQAYHFMTEFEYDSFGRMRRITYPDGENVTYNYYWGLLYSVKNEDQQTPYIQYIYYDEYGRPIETKYGNGFVATSEYDDVRRWAVRRELRDASQTPLQQTDYEYDGVGNITRVAQSAPTYDNNLGGEYIVDYTYDDQYRLSDAWQHNGSLGGYSYSMSYSLSGLAGYKNSPELNADMVLGYRYEGEFPLSHQPKMIYSPSYYEDITLLGWDTNGQMTSMLQPYQNRFRRHWWDETGRLAAAIGNDYCGYYGYNANGERVYKLTGSVYADQYNAGDVNIETYFDDVTLYVNPYMVITPRGYTKHYYNGSQRIAARLGGQWRQDSTFVQNQQWIVQAESLWETTTNTNDLDEQEILSEDVYVGGNGSALPACQYGPHIAQLSGFHGEDMLSRVFSGRASERTLTDTIGIYFYHPDHLGSANWITNSQGQAMQYIHYMPYGELWVNQQASQYDERFKFTGKERDTETGYDYFGARYYLSLLGIWMSPDPLLDEYPEISSYAYCKWNPVKNVDPDGKRIVVGTWYGRGLAKLGVNNFERQTMMYLKELKEMSPILNTAISKMEDSKTITISIYPMSQYDGDKNKGVTTTKTTVMGEKKDSEIYYDSNNGFLVDGDYSSPQAILAHELGYAENNMEGTSIKYDQKKARQGDAVEIQKGNLNEQKSIFYENIVRENQGDNARPYEYYKTEP